MDTPKQLTPGDFTTAEDPFGLFDLWMADAARSEPADPDAMTLATVDADGLPDARIVLLKGVDGHGFSFYTNYESAKGRELADNPVAALVFHWKSLMRQVRLRGTVERLSAAESDAYFASRPRGSRIAASASLQSQELDSRATFEAAVAAIEARYGTGEIPRPAHWGGYRLIPGAIEFWHDRPFRMHDRIVFTRATPGEPWRRRRLFP